MKSVTKTIQVVDKFVVEATAHSWRIETPGIGERTRQYVTFMDYQGNDFEIAVNTDFVKELKPGANQKIRMEITICQ